PGGRGNDGPKPQLGLTRGFRGPRLVLCASRHRLPVPAWPDSLGTELARFVVRLLQPPSHPAGPRGLPSCATGAAGPPRPPPAVAPQRGMGSGRYRTPAHSSPAARRVPRRRPPQLPNCAASAGLLPPPQRAL